jgi:hypothetical protein
MMKRNCLNIAPPWRPHISARGLCNFSHTACTPNLRRPFAFFTSQRLPRPSPRPSADIFVCHLIKGSFYILRPSFSSMHCTIPYHCSWFSYPHRRDIVLDFDSFLVLLARVYAVAKRFRTHAFKIFMYNAPDFSPPIPLLSPLEWSFSIL